MFSILHSVNLLIMLNTNTANSYTNTINNTGNNTILIITLTILIIWQSGSAGVIQPETKAHRLQKSRS